MTEAATKSPSRGKLLWTIQRTILFWIIGVLNTLFLRPEHVGGWRQWVGIVFLVIALADTIALIVGFVRRRQQASMGSAP
jgi:hypothetical protein